MRLARVVTLAAAALSGAALAVGYLARAAPDAEPVWFGVIGLLVLAWLAAEWRAWGVVASAAFVLSVALAAAGVLLGRSAAWMAATVTLGVTTWALGGYVRRVARLPHVEARDERARRFTLRLLALDALSAVLIAAALGLRVELPFAAVVILGAALLYGLSRVVGHLRREGV